MGQNLSKHGLKSFKLVKMVRNVSKWSKKWSENCSQVSKLVEWLKNGKNCFIVGQKWCKKMYSKRCNVGPKNGSKKRVLGTFPKN